MQQASPTGQTHPPSAGGGELVLGRYRRVRRIGAGGMGVVWLAHDEKLDRPVAVKRIATGDEAVARRAAREAKAAARLAHPAIVSLYETGRDEEAVYLVSELVVGSTLAALLEEGALSDRDVLQIGAALCDALAHAHGRGVIHRDVKPQNIIVPDTQQSGGGVAKLTDFGIAMLLDEDVLTRTGDVVGTIAYMAPEQAEGHEVTAQSDLYALALVVYEALSGVNPVRGRTPAATARNVGERLPRLERLRRDLPRELCAAIDQAVDPDPGRRGKLTDLRAGLRGHAGDVGDEPGTVEGSTLEPVTRITRRATRRATRLVAAPDAQAARGWAAEDTHAGRVQDGWGDAAPDGPWAWRPVPPSGRAVAAVGAGGLTAVALATLGPPPPFATPAAAVAVAAVVAVVPRLGALLTVLGLALWLLLAPEGVAPGVGLGHGVVVNRAGARAGDSGLALLVLAAGLPAVIALWRARPGWMSAPALAPLLGVLSLALAWPAIAGQARRVTHRLVLGALGCWWLLLVQALTGTTLLLGPVPGVRDPLRWTGSAQEAFLHVLAPLLTSGAVGIAAVWALAAAVLPFLIRGRHGALDIALATAWAAGLAAATQAVARALPGDGGPPDVRGAVLGAVLAGGLAVGARAARGPARERPGTAWRPPGRG
ncbi:serine/threonine protein kinase [Paraconexibacter antarcticus]|uniref:non-specific serine/threonine protein kinase n=1 Tax=Paraconexibacter antarcticus TaxID=2949664 RepID=A0ABY5DUL9_9ACTN|nr:serine/threonine-protein kinase [Paraconexibacter antarcticus]UTI64619.1 serine/threonine protein kinase [Paraconexibacter antarcticus]